MLVVIKRWELLLMVMAMVIKVTFQPKEVMRSVLLL